MDCDGPDALPPLYHACLADDRALVKKLLLEGANPNDGESVYHAAQLDRRECLELLLEHGADLSSRHATYRNTPLYFLAGHRESDPNAATVRRGMQWLLAHGADPNVTSGDLNETPLQGLARNGWGPAIAELLAAHGADLNLRRADGRSAYALSIRGGNTPMAEWLRGHGAHTSGVTAIDELLGACMEADEPKARTILSASPGLIRTLTREDGGTIVQAVYDRREASVRLMAELGFDLTVEGPWDGTPLHWAAWLGDSALVKLLLELGAPVNVRDSRYGSSPIAWAAHGSTNNDRPRGDYAEVTRLLLDAGSERAPSYNRWSEPPESMGSPDVVALLRARGFAP